MTIRKRYDEATLLAKNELHEPALILALVAISAASERRRLRETGNAKKQLGDDKKWFKSYIGHRIQDVTVQFGGTSTTLSECLYKDLRCDLVHEAASTQFTENEMLFTLREGRLVFGLHLIPTLLEALRTDPLGRDEFRDLLTEFDNLVEIVGNEEEVFQRIAETFSISPGRVRILSQVIAGLQPERILAMSYEQAAEEFATKVLPNLSAFGLSGGSLTALRSVLANPLLDTDYALLEHGFHALQAMSEHYRTADRGTPETTP